MLMAHPCTLNYKLTSEPSNRHICEVSKPKLLFRMGQKRQRGGACTQKGQSEGRIFCQSLKAMAHSHPHTHCCFLLFVFKKVGVRLEGSLAVKSTGYSCKRPQFSTREP